MISGDTDHGSNLITALASRSPRLPSAPAAATKPAPANPKDAPQMLSTSNPQDLSAPALAASCPAT
jgi:hypothetical protein